MNNNIEDSNKDARYWMLAAGGWVPMSEVMKNHEHLESSIKDHFPNTDSASTRDYERTNI